MTPLTPIPVPRLISTATLSRPSRSATSPIPRTTGTPSSSSSRRSWLRCPAGGAARVDLRRHHALVAVEDNYDRLGYGAGDVTRDSRYSRHVGETVMLRSHTSAGVPPVLQSLAREGRDDDILLVLPDLCYRRDSIDRLRVATPHQVDLWRVAHRR